MTAPMIPANGGAGDSTKLLDMEDAEFAAAIGLEKTGPTAPVEAEAKPVDGEPARGADGKFVKKEEAVAEETPVETEAVAEETPVEEAAVEETPAEPVRVPLTKFQVFDPEGELEPPSDLTFRFKVDGKMVDEPIDKVVHMAQSAKYNARQVQELTERNTAGDAQLMQLQQQVAEYENAIAQMYADPNLYERAKALHQANNSPEMVAQAARAEAAQLRKNYQAQQEQATVAQFVSGTIEPALLELTKEYPTVDMEDLAGRLALVSKGFEVDGRVPVANLPRIAHWMETELAGWAASVHAKRSQASTAASKTLDKERAATQAKQRQIGKALAPVGASAASAPKPTPIVRARDVLNDPMFGGA